MGGDRYWAEHWGGGFSQGGQCMGAERWGGALARGARHGDRKLGRGLGQGGG